MKARSGEWDPDENTEPVDVFLTVRFREGPPAKSGKLLSRCLLLLMWVSCRRWIETEPDFTHLAWAAADEMSCQKACNIKFKGSGRSLKFTTVQTSEVSHHFVCTILRCSYKLLFLKMSVRKI